MKQNDTAKFKDIDSLYAHIFAMTDEEGKAFAERVEQYLKDNRPGVYPGAPLKDMDSIITRCAEDMYRAYQYANYTPEQNLEGSWVNVKKRALERITRFGEYAATEPINIGRWVTGEFAYLYLGNPNKGIVVPTPEKYLEYIEGKDYSAVSPASLQAALNPTGMPENIMLPVKGDGTALTHRDLEQSANDLSAGIDQLLSDMDDVKKAKTGELAEMQKKIDAMMAEMEAKKKSMMAEMEAKKAEMEAKLEQMNNQIYLLDSQIYSILCYNGETVKFTKLTEGKKAADTEPIIIFQKLRFLDEELGKLASLYTIQWGQLKKFEDLLRYNPTARETFAPYDRCIQLVRLSRTGKDMGRAKREDGLPTNLLTDYEYYHGKTIGIIIRNGENIYLGWTDESRVHIEDDLLVDFSKTVTMPAEEKSPYSYFSEKDREKKEKAEKKRFIDGVISRQFVFNILQGVVDHSDILPLPAGITLGNASEYVVYSMAEGALDDNRYGTFNELIEKCNASPRKGDMLLTVQRLSPEYWEHRDMYRAWCNPRGRGDANRTHDASVDDCTLYPLNVIDIDTVPKRLNYKEKGSDSWCWVKLDPYLLETEDHYRTMRFISKFQDKARDELDAMAVQVEDVDGTMRTVIPPELGAWDLCIEQPDPITHIFVSVEKDSDGWGYGYRGEKAPRANFELYSKEYINLTFMNSVWLEYVISTQKLGGWTIGGQPVLYSYGIRYLKTALDYIRKREKQEKTLIDAIDPEVCKDPMWPLKLTEWKMENSAHTMTEYQAKRFIKARNHSKSHQSKEISEGGKDDGQ